MAAPRAALLLVALAAGLACRRDAQPPPAAGAGSEPAPAPAATDAPAATADTRAATLLWPAREHAGLVPREIFVPIVQDPSATASSVVGILLGPPPEPALVAPLPAGTRLLSLFIDERGVATVNLSREAVALAPGGSAWELAAVHSLVGSLTRSVPQVRRMRLLVEGREIETLAGHLDLRDPVTFDESLLAP